jgi:hypothetical protein
MSRAISVILQAGILLSAVAGIPFAIRIIQEQTIAGSWYWGAAIVVFAGPALFAVALYVIERHPIQTSASSEAVR